MEHKHGSVSQNFGRRPRRHLVSSSTPFKSSTMISNFLANTSNSPPTHATSCLLLTIALFVSGTTSRHDVSKHTLGIKTKSTVSRPVLVLQAINGLFPARRIIRSTCGTYSQGKSFKSLKVIVTSSSPSRYVFFLAFPWSNSLLEKY
jgi:hypothetical protein